MPARSFPAGFSAARANRIRMLKAQRPDLTWEGMAREVGVTVRAAQKWGETGEISHANAVKLADLFDVDVRYLHLGAAQPLLPEHQTSLDRIEAKLDDLLARLGSENGLAAA